MNEKIIGKIMKKYLSLWLIGLCVIGFSTQTQGQEILDKEWIVTQIGKEKVSVSAEKTPWIKLSEGRVSGFSACNRMIGSYTLEGETLTFGAIGGTKMFCQEVADLEDVFIQTLQKIRYWKSKSGKLRLFDEKKKLIMKFKIKK